MQQKVAKIFKLSYLNFILQMMVFPNTQQCACNHYVGPIKKIIDSTRESSKIKITLLFFNIFSSPLTEPWTSQTDSGRNTKSTSHFKIPTEREEKKFFPVSGLTSRYISGIHVYRLCDKLRYDQGTGKSNTHPRLLHVRVGNIRK